jgi:uncharacterized membrane protein
MGQVQQEWERVMGRWGKYRLLAEAVLLANAVSGWLFIMRVLGTDNFRYWFLLWNLFLAWVPLACVLGLLLRLRTRRLLERGNVALSVLWFLFLPNSFYLVSDLIHLHFTGEVSVLFDAAMFMSFIINGWIAGYSSLLLMHRLLLQKVEAVKAHFVVLGVLVSCSFAIYLGRDLRWNSWDVVTNPAGILFDVSERLINPIAHPQAFTTTFTFSLLLGSTYLVLWRLVRLLGGSHQR